MAIKHLNECTCPKCLMKEYVEPLLVSDCYETSIGEFIAVGLCAQSFGDNDFLVKVHYNPKDFNGVERDDYLVYLHDWNDNCRKYKNGIRAWN